MTLEILEGTVLDLGPEFWAFSVVVTLFLIEVFQLGPHKFAALSKNKGKDKHKRKFNNKGGASRGRYHAPIDKAYFRDFVVNVYYLREKDALLYVGQGENDLELCPKPPEQLAEGMEAKIYPQSSDEMDNYVIAQGEDPEVTAVRQSGLLWGAKDRSNAKYIVLYSSRVPSTYAVQCIAEELGKYANRVGVSVLYSDDGGEEEEGRGLEDKEHLSKAGITLEKIEF